MQQSSVIFGVLFIAFIVYITTEGKLPTYIGLLKGGSTTSTAGVASQIGPSLPSTPSSASLEQEAEKLLSTTQGIQIATPAPPGVIE